MALRILFRVTGAHGTLFRINGCWWLFCYICVPPPVKVMILVREITFLEGCAIRVGYLVFPTFLCVGAMVHMIRMMLVGILKGGDVILDHILLGRKAVISNIDTVCSG